jgi:hypothetical protein
MLISCCAPDVRRRFERSIRNFLFRHRSLADCSVLFGNTAQIPRIIASQERRLLRVRLTNLYNQLRKAMSKSPSKIVDLPLAERALMALKVAVKKAIRQHAREGLPIYVWGNGKVLEIPSDKLRSELMP